ncbi:MAG: hypothetical protein LQ338_008030 [Usnochroma carphineum]|nr:MAG: hypothetical protein LQ338_008030 [Usnochroma carphineum]
MSHKHAKAKQPVQAHEQKRQDPDSGSEEFEIDLSLPLSDLLRKLERERPKAPPGLPGFDTPPISKAFDAATMPDHPIQTKPPPDNIAEDPYRVNDPWGVKDSNPVIDRGEIWQVIDDPKRREAGIKEWEQAQQSDPSAKAEDLYPEAPDFLAMPRPEYHDRKIEELFKHRDARRYELIKDEDIYDAIKAGPAVVEQLRDWERRWILDKEGVPPKRPITASDLDTLYSNYVNLLGPPGHKFPGCIRCEKSSAKKLFAYYTHKKKTREGGESDEAWHFRDNHEAKPVDRARKKFLKALVGFHAQEKKAKEQALIVAKNISRAETGKKPIPLNETRVEKFVREIDEGIRTLPSDDPASDEGETEEQANLRVAAELQASKETMARIRAEEDVQRLRTAWQRYRNREAFLKLQGQSAVDALEKPFSVFSNYYPCGLPYNGKLVYDKKDIAAGDWERFKENRAAFEEEEDKKLEEGTAGKEQWDRYITGVLEEFKPPRSILTEEPKPT